MPLGSDPTRWPAMLMVGAAGRNAGKTELCCSLIRRLCPEHEIAGVKVTTVSERDGRCPRGGEGCGVCSTLAGAFCLTEEHGELPDKDTSRLLRAGASRVLWLRVLRESLREGLYALRARLGDALCICESNSLRHVVEPGVFVVVRGSADAGMKPSAREVAHHADGLVASDGAAFDVPLDAFSIAGGRWRYRRPATAIVLAGGRSSRMGRDKCLIDVAGQPLLRRVVDQLRPGFERVIVSANDPSKYAFLGLPVVPDRVPDQGPMMGLVSAMAAAEHELCFVTACDVPDVPLSFVSQLLRAAERADGRQAVEAVVPVGESGRYEPLLAVYRRSLLPALESALGDGERTLARFLDRQPGVLRVPLPPGRLIGNLNTMRDFDEYMGLLSAG